MRLRDIVESVNFEDRTLGPWAYTPMGANVVNGIGARSDVSNGAPDGYKNWLPKSLKDLAPRDVDVMRRHGLTIEEMQRVKAMMDGSIKIDPSAYPYRNGVQPR